MTNAPTHRYLAHNRWTDPGSHAGALRALGGGPSTLCTAAQTVLIHVDNLDYYGLDPTDRRASDRTSMTVKDRLDSLTGNGFDLFDPSRPAERKSRGTCRDFALMHCAMLREHEIPARVRCGFADYFRPDFWSDHWVCEYWHAKEQRWALADGQLDVPHRNELSIDFPIHDLPRQRFRCAHEAWRDCRNGGDPDTYGHLPDKGLWFIRVNLIRDLLAVNGREVSDWDGWRQMPADDRQLGPENIAYGDHLAETAAKTDAEPEFDADPDIPPPPWHLIPDTL